ncbi:hypothetical protein DFQ01_103201 [Paenibacillus cellulosilyticus]|uniref:Uncharacterized protein n=1 Tax=Paenibacillus cellulosilyticus TaxID=375489 RepID=A0A2V2Z129_9BACL|nr:hypothetical protein [Paenibacillus cellulosilyticus]PWW06299.1 hypothetical protein DFQ01_103201 [Paenibacillus cellulosilyticus]QKS42954.1 hypothetical protein HUB94_00190 [Paenibacillus cellulosilyticus]
MVRTNKRKGTATPTVPSTRSVAGAIFSLKETMKRELGIEAEVSVRIHGWTFPERLAKLALKDMISEVMEWEIHYNHYDGTQHLEEYSVWSAQSGGGRGKERISIFTSKKKRAATPLPRSTKKYSPIAYATHWIRQLVRELYGVDADVRISVHVDRSDYWFSTPKNAHIKSEETAIELMQKIQAGTNWEIQDFEKYSISKYSRTARLEGSGVEFTFYLPKKNEQEMLSE